MALSHIFIGVNDELLHLITECETAKAPWDKVQAHFECDSLANHLFLNKKYLRTVMDENELIKSHLKHMKEITNELTAIKAPVCEEDQVATLLGNLPDSYDSRVTAPKAHVETINITICIKCSDG